VQISQIDTWIRAAEGLEELSRKELEKLQLEKLNCILAKEKMRNGFYSRLPERLDHLDELQTLPFTDSQELANHGSQMVLVSQAEISKVTTEMTSGTTGAAKRLFYTPYDRERTRCFFTAGLSEMIMPGEKVLVCMPSEGAEGLLALICDGIKRLGAIPIAFGVGRSYEAFLEINIREAPDCFIGMPVPLLSVLRYASFLGITMSVKKALLSADACAPSVFSAIAEYLPEQPFLHYGLREGGLGGAVNCQAFAGMHVRENDILVEIVDENGIRVKDGELGELVITTIGMEAMPLIRYKTGDKTRFLTGECRCKSQLKRLDHVLRMGKESEIVALDEILFAYPEVIDYKATRSQGKLNIEIAVGKAGNLIEKWNVCGFAEEIKIEMYVLDPADMPCYLGKRRILCSGEIIEKR